jgi:hypothetical protein
MSSLIIYRVTLAAVVLTTTSAGLLVQSQAQGIDPDIRRLPLVATPHRAYAEPVPPNTKTSPRRLPSLPPETAEVDQDLLIFAGGAVEATVPAGWNVTEIPAGRELRLWLTPAPNPAGQVPSEGIWMVYHWLGRPPRQNEVLKLLDLRVPSGSRPSAVETEQLPLSSATGLLREFQRQDRRGFHLVVDASHGILEVAVEASPQNYPDLRQKALGVLAGMKLAEPDLRTAAVRPPIVDARPVIGLWKGLRARMQLSGDGRVVIQFDSAKNYPLDKSGNLIYSQRINRLTGSYRAEDDMLFVQWDDGSRLNYRWRLDDGRLLLTDHNGRVSQLHRLVQ